jgi:hypothetical protein
MGLYLIMPGGCRFFVVSRYRPPLDEHASLKRRDRVVAITFVPTRQGLADVVKHRVAHPAEAVAFSMARLSGGWVLPIPREIQSGWFVEAVFANDSKQRFAETTAMAARHGLEPVGGTTPVLASDYQIQEALLVGVRLSFCAGNISCKIFSPHLQHFLSSETSSSGPAGRLTDCIGEEPLLPCSFWNRFSLSWHAFWFTKQNT